MDFLIVWPNKHTSITLDESFTSEMTIVFDVLTGTFSSSHNAQPAENCVLFYWTLAGPAMFNACSDFVCIVDGIPLEKDETRMLHVGAEMQIGHYQIQAVMGENMSSPDDMFYMLNGDEREKNNVVIPEIEEILPRGAHYIGDLNYCSEIASKSNAKTDVIKILELEYKNFLIWGEINNNIYNKEKNNSRHIINDDVFFDSARSKMESKTLTECVLAAPSLIDKVWDELDVVELQDEILHEEDRYEILMMLAPEKFMTKEKRLIPELAFHDLHKIGLDSHY